MVAGFDHAQLAGCRHALTHGFELWDAAQRIARTLHEQNGGAQGEQHLVGAPDVRFGSVKMMFKSTPVPAEDDMKGTRAIASFGVEAAKKAAEKKRATQAALEQPEPAPLPAEKKKGCMAMVAFLVTFGVASASMMAILLTIRG